ncbi:MAG: DUF1292 domain-containing protein [Bacilli bacterium]|nr:DUF1292 domain-containing protein [Bacilli bacterium]
MEKELDVVTIDGVNYLILEKIDYNDNSYVYLSNVMDMNDTLIKKIDKNDSKVVVPLDDENEFELACNLFLKFMLDR